LENQFGRKNVYIDVEMHAGAKYPAVIEKRLAECRVLLVLIGPDWVKLQKPNDWVEREVAYALNREITVIPVLINGAQLPDKELLPDNIQELLDHQAASVTIAGFRHEMAGLVKDIRSIATPKPWRLFGALAAALILSVTVGIFVRTFGFYNLLERTRLPAPSLESPAPSPEATSVWTNGVWKSRNGEWVLYAVDNSPAAHFVNPSSIKSFGGRVAYTTRFALNPSSEARSYEDDVEVLDCKRSVFAPVEKTIYNSAGKVIYWLKSGEPESSDLSTGQTIWPTDIVATSQRIMCDEQLRTLLLSKARFGDKHLSYLANAPDGDGSVFYGPIKPTSNPAYPIEALFVAKKTNDHGFTDIFHGQNVRGLPPGYRTFAEHAQINCPEKKLLAPALEYYDSEDNLAYLAVSGQPVDVKNGTIFAALLNVACSPLNVAGSYEGTNYISYGTKGQAEQAVSIAIQQNGSDLKVSFQTPSGASGEGTGELKSNRADSISLHSTTPGCPGSYDGPLSFADNSVSWSYKGEDCGGAMEGHGTAIKVTSSDLNH
jgi:TIR domain